MSDPHWERSSRVSPFPLRGRMRSPRIAAPQPRGFSSGRRTERSLPFRVLSRCRHGYRHVVDCAKDSRADRAERQHQRDDRSNCIHGESLFRRNSPECGNRGRYRVLVVWSEWNQPRRSVFRRHRQLTVSNPTVTTLRAADIFGGQLYVSASTPSFVGINAIGNGLPTSADQQVALVIPHPVAVPTNSS